MIKIMRFIKNPIGSVRSSFSLKLIISNVLLIILPFTICGIYIFNLTHEAYKKEMFNLIEKNLDQIEININEKIDLCMHNINLINFDSNLVSLLEHNYYSDSYIVDLLLRVTIPKLDLIKSQNKFIYNLKIIHWNNSMFRFVFDYMYYEQDFLEKGWQDKLKTMDTQKKYTPYNAYVEAYHNENIYFKIDEYTPKKVLTIYQPILSTLKDRMIGIIEMDILQDTIIDSLVKNTLNENGVLIIAGQEGALIYTNENGLLYDKSLNDYKNFSPIIYKNNKYYVAKRDFSRIKTAMILLIPESNLNSGRLYIVFGSVFIASFVLFCTISYFISKLLLKRLMALSNVMKNIKKGGNLQVSAKINGCDEISDLSKNFNDMLISINTLMVNLEISGITEKEAIYKALENQINPHFLCNALDCIRMKAELYNQSDIASATSMIVRYFMYNLKTKDKYVTVEDELNNVIRYIEIYNLIKNNSIKYFKNISPELSNVLGSYYILKFLLQPVVENSIIHGFKNVKSNCLIHIEVTKKENLLIITVQDNGSGISGERLDELEKHLDLVQQEYWIKTSENGIGLRNIKERMYLNYGSAGSLKVESYPDMGTLVTIKVPIVVNEGNQFGGLKHVEYFDS